MLRSMFYFPAISDSRAQDFEFHDIWVHNVGISESKFYARFKSIKILRIRARKLIKLRFSLNAWENIFDIRIEISVKFRVEWCIFIYDLFWIRLHFPKNSYLRRRDSVRNIGLVILSVKSENPDFGIRAYPYLRFKMKKTAFIYKRRFENLKKQNQREARYIGSSLKSFLIYWICFCIATLLLIQFCFHDYIFIYI